MLRKITITTLLMVSFSIFFTKSVFSKDISSNTQERALTKVLEDFGDRYNVFFSYEESMVKGIKTEFEFIENENIYIGLDRLLEAFDLTYDTFGEKYIVIFKKSVEASEDLTKLKRHFEEIEKIESKGRVKVLKRKSSKKSKKSKKKNSILGQVIKETSVEKAVLNEITGTVTDPNGEALIGVNILVKGTSRGTITDLNGNYNIEVDEGAVLVFSYTGFMTKSVTVTGQNSYNIILSEDSQSLDEVVVVGYGIKKKSHLTGAITKIEGDDVTTVQSTRVDEALQGRLAGVRVQNVDGQPGAAPKVQVRAGGSITGAGNPLVFVDGYPISGDLSTINPVDIESIEVLKDASSAAIYGSRGANGVIMITTKKGKTTKAQFGYNTHISSSSPYRKNYELYPTLSEHITNIEANTTINNGVVTSDTGWPTEKSLGVPGYDQLFIQRLKLYKDTDALGLEQNYKDNVFQTGITQNHDFNVRGGSEDMRYYASVGYLDAGGTIAKSEFKRYSGRLNLDANLTNKITVGLSFNGTVSNRSLFPDINFRLADAIRTQSFVPTHHTAESIALVQAHDGWLVANGYAGTNQGAGPDLANLQAGDFAHEWHWNRWQTTVNGYNIPNGIGLSFNNGATAKIDGRNKTQQTYFGNAVAYLDYEIIDGLNFKTSLGADMNNYNTFENLETPAAESGIGATLQNESTQLTTTWLSQNTLNYNKDLGVHTVNLLAGYEFGQETYKALFINGNEYSADGLFTYGSLRDVQVSNFEEYISRKSVFFRAGYAYDDRYLFSASIRRDGDSRFGANNQWANFPAVSLGWNIHNEDFFNIEAINKLKLRASYGALGSVEGLGAYDALSSVQTVATTLGGSNVIGFTNSNVANPNLSWQITSEQNFGADLSFLDYRFNLSVDYFISTTEDMLLQKGISSVTGFTSTTVNQGNLESNGIEVEVSARIISTSDFTWMLAGNISSVNTTVVDTGNESGFSLQPDARLPEFRTYAGGQISEFWGYETTGEVIDEKYTLTPGYPINGTVANTYIVDQNGDGIINADDYVLLGSNAPDFTWGISSNMKYKKFDLAIVFSGSHGAEVANTDDFFYRAHWKGATNSLFPENQLVGEKTKSDLFIQDASFVAFRNLTLGYTLKGDKNNSRLKFDNIRFYLASTNLLYLFGSDYTGFNPEGVNFINPTNPIEFGGQRGASPINRAFTAGLNVNF